MEPREEFFHVPGDAEYWSESHYLDFLDDAAQGHLRIGFYPNRGTANVFAYLLTDDTILHVREPTVPLDAVHGLTVRRDDWRISMTPAVVGRDWTVTFEGSMRECADPAAVAAGDGTPTDVEFAITSRARHEPFLYSAGRDDIWGPDEDRYEVATRVDGSVTIDGVTREVEGPGERDHSWGVRDWTDGEWLWISGSFADGTAYNHLSAWAPGRDPSVVNGFWFDGERVHPLTDAAIAADPPFGVETATDWLAGGEAPSVSMTLEWAGGTAEVTADPTATTPIEWTDGERGTRSVLNRSPARQVREGPGGRVEGRGFLENMIQLERA